MAAKRSNSILLVVSALTFLVGAALVVVILRNSDDGTPSSGTAGPTVGVLVAKERIAKGTPGEQLASKVEVRQVPTAQRQVDAIVAVTELSERVATVDVASGDQLRNAYFTDRTLRGSTVVIPEGKQALAVSIPLINAGGGYIGRGDYVDVFGMFTRTNNPAGTVTGEILHPQTPCASRAVSVNGGGALSPNPNADGNCSVRLLLSNVLVLERSFEQAPIGVQSAPSTTIPGSPGAISRVTTTASITFLVAVDAPQAEKLIFFQRYEELYLSLKPRGADGKPAQPDSSAGGRDQVSALKP